jgi:hypothetical protein
MTRTDIYNASSKIFSELPDEDTFAADMADSEKASKAFNSIVENKDKYDEMGVALPESVEEFQAIVTGDPKKKSTSQGQSGNAGSTQTQQSSGSKPAQSSQQGPRVFQPKRVFNSIEDINNYAGYLEGYKNDPAAKAEKQWFDENYANITDEFWKQNGKPLTVQGPPVKQEKTASVNYDKSTLPTTGRKSSIDNKEFLRTEQPKKVIPRMSEEELMGQAINETTPAQDVMQAPINIQQAVVQSEQQSKREQEGAKVQGMSAEQIIDKNKKEDQKADLNNFYDNNYSKVESLINNGFGTRSNDVDFTKLNVNNRSELENAYGLLEQDYLEYLQKVDPQEYERVKNEIQGIRSKKGEDINTGERQVIDQFRAKAMEMHNLVNGYVMHEIDKNYDMSGYFGGASALSIQVDDLDKKIKELNVDPSGKGVSPAKAQQYQALVEKRNKLVEQYNTLGEKYNIPPEVIAKYQDVANRYLDSSVVITQLSNLDTELAAKKAANMKAAQERYNEAESGDYTIGGEFARGYSGTVGKSITDLFTTTWDVIGEATGDTDYDIWDQIANFGRGYNFEREKMFGTAQDFSIDQKEYSDLPLAYRMTGITSSGLGSISLSAGGGVLGMATGIGSTVGGGMLMLGSALSDNYNEALRNGYSGKEAANYATIIAGLEIAFESAFPDFKIFDAPGAKQSLLKAVASSPDVKTAFQVFIDNLPAALKTEAKIAGENFLKEGVIEEVGSQFASDIVKSKFNEMNKDKGQFEVFKGEDYQNTLLGGFLGAETANIIGRLGSVKMPHEESILFQAAINPDILSLADKNGIIVSDEMKDVINTFQTIDDAMKSKPGYDNLSDDQKAHVVSEIQRMKYLEEQNKKVGIDDKATQDEIANIKSSVETILQNALKPKEEKENAVQEPSTEEVLPREQGTTPETGGQPQGMGQDVQGQEVTQEGQEVSQEGVTKLNQETFAEDVTPEQKTKVEEQNQKDENEAVTEIYDFNDDIKSVGTKDQFKQFLRSLSPTAAFSRIAWHNTSKSKLEPREGQYYTNTRKNAEDTYKQENTFPAIVFGNAPKKASFDEVQDVDTEAIKGEGADVVITDDLSPAIGADMNYREFVPTSADQIIPIGTKENIEAFKAFVEQQKSTQVQENDQKKISPEQKQIESQDYVSKLEETKKQNPKDFWSVSTPDIEDVKSGTLINVEGGQAIVDKSGDIRGLYKFAEAEQKGVGDKLVQKAIDAGGVKLDNFAKPDLMKIYLRNGFRVASRMPFNEEYAPEGWDEKEHGKPDVVAMVYDPDNLLDIEEKQFTKDDYDEAIEYRDTYMDSQKDAYGDKKEKQSIADKIRSLKSKGGKLYSAGLGIPVAIWDGAVEIIATAVEAGEGLINGINKAKKYLQEKLKDKYNEDLVDELLDNVINQSPIQIQSKSLKGEKVKANPEGHNLSFVKPEDLIDIESLIKDIESKGEKVWFWVADQLGRGIYSDKKTGNQHFLDAGPSFALDPENRKNGVIWASGMESTAINKNIENADYIFIISGSPTQSKLFNKAVFKLFQDKLGDYKKFKSEVLNAKTTKGIREVLNAHNSWDTIIEDSSTDNAKTKKVGTGRKKMLIELVNAFDKPNSGLYKILESRDALLDINSIRDGFYADNNFDVNDVMLVLKPEKIGGKSKHSTYENDILGEVVGIPDKKIDAYDILPNYLRNEKDITKVLQTSRIAPYGSGIREVSAKEAIERETKNKAESIRSNKLNEAVDMLSDAEETGGSEITKAQKEVSEKLGEEGKKIAEIDRNFDKLADELGFIKTCII